MITKNNNIVSYHQSPLFKWCEKHIPYWPFIFKNKRQRVKCRWFFRYFHMRKANNDLTKSLMKIYKNHQKPDYTKINYDFDDLYWELETKKN